MDIEVRAGQRTAFWSKTQGFGGDEQMVSHAQTAIRAGDVVPVGSHKAIANDVNPVGAAAALLSFSPSDAELTYVRDPELFDQLLESGVGVEDERG